MVNGKIIYPIQKGQTIIIKVPTKKAKVVVTDGYHISRPFDVVYKQMQVYYIKIVCRVDDDQVVLGFILLLLFYAGGITADLLYLKALSFMPVLWFLFVFYFKPQVFLQIKEA